MKRYSTSVHAVRAATTAMALLLVLVAGAAAFQAESGTFEVDWWTVDGGGGRSEGGTFVVHGTMGQHDANQSMTGGDFEVQGGFWGITGNLGSCPGDTDKDGDVDVDDLTDLILAWDPPGNNCPCGNVDVDGDGDVDVDDLVDLILAWGPC